MSHVLYECGICSNLHPWDFNGDCRDDKNRYAGVDEYAAMHNVSESDIEIRSMDDRVAADTTDYMFTIEQIEDHFLSSKDRDAHVVVECMRVVIGQRPVPADQDEFRDRLTKSLRNLINWCESAILKIEATNP